MIKNTRLNGWGGLILGLGIFLNPGTLALAAPEPAQVLPSEALAGKWEKTSDDDGITVFKKEVPGSTLIAFKGQTVIPASIVKLSTILLDESRAKDWVDKLESIKILRRPAVNEFVQYTHIGTPFVVKDREFVMHGKVTIDPVAHTLVLSLKSVDDPLAPKTDYVRGEVMDSSFTLKSLDNGTKTHVTAQIFADPKGDMGKWMVNMFQKDWPKNTLTALRRESARKDVPENPTFKNRFPGVQGLGQ